MGFWGLEQPEYRKTWSENNFQELKAVLCDKGETPVSPQTQLPGATRGRSPSGQSQHGMLFPRPVLRARVLLVGVGQGMAGRPFT